MNVNLAALPLPPPTQATTAPQSFRRVESPSSGQAARQRFQVAIAAPQGIASASSADRVAETARSQTRHRLGSYLPTAAPTLFRVR